MVLDPVGGDRFTDSLRSLREGGRVVVVGFTGGSIPEVRVNRLLLNNTEVIGAGWGAYVIPKPKLTAEIGAGVDRPDRGRLRPAGRRREVPARAGRRRARADRRAAARPARSSSTWPRAYGSAARLWHAPAPCRGSSSATATACRSPPGDPVVSLGEGSTPLVLRRAPVRTRRRRGLAEARGREPDRLVQGPRHDVRGLGGRARGRRGGDLRLDRQHRRLGRGLRRAGGAARRGDRARGQDRHRQARPGADARRAGGRAARQLRRGADARARARRAPPGLARQLGQRVPHRGSEDGGVRARRGSSTASSTRCASRSATPATSPRTGRASSEVGHSRGCSGSRPPARRRSSTAPRSSTRRRSRARSGSATPPAGRRR